MWLIGTWLDRLISGRSCRRLAEDDCSPRQFIALIVTLPFAGSEVGTSATARSGAPSYTVRVLRPGATLATYPGIAEVVGRAVVDKYFGARAEVGPDDQ